jgi:hypothetical protein
MAICAAIKRNGTRCSATAIGGSQWCYAHDPANAERRTRDARRGGKSGGRGRPAIEVADIKSMLAGLVTEVKEGKLDTFKAYAINALLNTRLRAIEIERKIREQEELEQRIEALEAASAQTPTPRRGNWRSGYGS